MIFYKSHEKTKTNYELILYKCFLCSGSLRAIRVAVLSKNY